MCPLPYVDSPQSLDGNESLVVWSETAPEGTVLGGVVPEGEGSGDGEADLLGMFPPCCHYSQHLDDSQ